MARRPISVRIFKIAEDRIASGTWGQQVRNSQYHSCKPCSSLPRHSDGGEQVRARLVSGDALAMLWCGWREKLFNSIQASAGLIFVFSFKETQELPGANNRFDLGTKRA